MKNNLRLRHILAVCALCSVTQALTLTAAAQRADMFHWLFPNPSNNNGYEEFIRAAEMIQIIPELTLAMQTDATLATKRRVLAMPRVARALSLVRDGLAKPVGSPRDNITENTLFPEMAMFRMLARLIAVEEYVNFADGRVDSAIDSLKTGLSFGYRVQMDTLIAGLVGIAMDAIVMKGFGANINQLSVFQCDRVVSLMKEFLAADKPGVQLMAMEKSHVIKMLESRRTDPQSLIKLLEGESADATPEQQADFQILKDHLTGSPDVINQTITDAEARISAMYDLAAQNINLPLAKQIPFVKDSSNAPGAVITRSVTVNPRQIVNKYAGADAMYRLLAVHALIRRYRWDHNALPSSLTELHADDLIVDPFTGDKIVYKRVGELYELFSAGPNSQDEATGDLTGPRVPIKL